MWKFQHWDHDLEHHETKAPACTEAGNAYDTCKREGCDYTVYTAIPALGHNWGEAKYIWVEDNLSVTARWV